MNREQFLNELKDALCGMMDDEIEGVLSYYGEMIDDRMEAGMTEEAAVRAMEPVDVIAARVLGEAGNGNEEAAAKPEKKEENRQEICRAVESVQELQVDAQNKRIRISSADQSDIVLRYYIAKNDVYQLHEDNGILRLENRMRPMSSFANEKSEGSFSLDLLLNNVGKFLNNLGDHIVAQGAALINGFDQMDEIEVLLPRAFHGKLNITSCNASIRAKAITCADAIRLTTSNARIVLENSAARAVHAATSNARIEMMQVYAREGIEAHSSNGCMVMTDVSTDTQMHASTSNSRVVLENVQAHDLYVKTSNGSVSGTVVGSEEEFTIHSGTSNGSNNLGKREGGEKTLSVKTSNGAINVTFTADNG